MRKYLLISIFSLALLGITSCSSEKIKENREKYEQQKAMSELKTSLKILVPFMEILLEDSDVDLNIVLESLENKTIKFTLEVIMEDNEVYAGSLNESDKEDFKESIQSALRDYLKKGHSFIFEFIVKQGRETINLGEILITPEDISEVNVTFKK